MWEPGFPLPRPGPVCVQSEHCRDQTEGAALSLCHAHSAITLGPGGERKKEGRTLKRDLELERGLLSGLEFNFVVGSVLIYFQ